LESTRGSIECSANLLPTPIVSVNRRVLKNLSYRSLENGNKVKLISLSSSNGYYFQGEGTYTVMEKMASQLLASKETTVETRKPSYGKLSGLHTYQGG
jgi:hypothetical protein